MDFEIKTQYDSVNAQKISFVPVQEQLDQVITNGEILMYQAAPQFQFNPVTAQTLLNTAGINTSGAWNLDSTVNTPITATTNAWTDVTVSFPVEDNNITGASFVNGLLTLPAGKYQVQFFGAIGITGSSVIGTVSLRLYDTVALATTCMGLLCQTESDYENLSPVVMLDTFTSAIPVTLQLQIFSNFPTNFVGSNLAGVPARSASLVVTKLA